MALYFPDKYKKVYPSVNEELAQLIGELDDREARIALGKFLRANLGFGLELLTKRKLKLAYYQEIILKGIFNRNFSLFVGSRGASKSFLAAIIAFLFPLFNKGTNVLLAGPTFRTARHIFTNLEKIVQSKEAELLLECFGAKTRRNDAFEWVIHDGVIRAVPMNSEKIRGFRANVLILDEFLLLSEDIVKKVLIPFLIVPTDITNKMIKTEEEDTLIKLGKMKEEDRMVFPSSARMVCLTSASYTFEYVYELYTDWINNIMNNEKVEDATYFVAQLGYKAIPTYLVEKSVIQEASAAGEGSAIFQREFGGQFMDGSENYFNVKKMHNLTISDGERPTTLIKGKPDKKYVLSIDPNYNDSPTSDFFAMAVLELDEENEKATLVHNHAGAGAGLKEYINYFYYLLNSFNIVLICVDNADGGFIQSANESVLFQQNRTKIELLDYDGELQGEEYEAMLRSVKKKYNLNGKVICFKHIFQQNSIRRINEQLQTWINTSRIFFGSRLNQHPEDYDVALKSNIFYPFTEQNPESISEFVYNLIEIQDDLIPQVKKQCSLIEVDVKVTGGQTFSLPLNLQRQTGVNRPRKDNYTCLLLGIEAATAYFNMNRMPLIEKRSIFRPILVGKSTRY